MSYDYVECLAELRDKPEESKQILEKAKKIISDSVSEDLKNFKFKDISEYNSTALALLKNPYYNFRLAGFLGENDIELIWLFMAIEDSAQKFMKTVEPLFSQIPCGEYGEYIETNETVKKIIEFYNLNIPYSYL